MEQSIAIDAELFVEATYRAERSLTLARVDPDGSAPLVFVNKAFERITGYSAAEAVGQDCCFLQGADTDAASVATVRNALKLCQAITVTLLNYRKDGTAFWNELSLSPVPSSDGVLHYVGVQSDVTERIQTQHHLERLYRSEREAHVQAARTQSRLEAILEQMPAGVVISEADKKWSLNANPEMERIMRCSIDSTTDPETLFRGTRLDGRPYRPIDWPLYRAQSRGDVTIDEEIVIVRGDDSKAVVSVRATPIRNDEGEIVAAVALFEDITQRKGWEEQLTEERERSLSLAWTLQRSLLPPALPTGAPGIDFGATYIPVAANLHVGGDFYDVLEKSPGSWLTVIGDVMGKGAEAATVSTLARHSLRTASLRSNSPEVMLSLLNQALLQDGEDRPFCTAAVAMVHQTPSGADVVLGLGGHPRPYVARANGEVMQVGVSGTLIGVMDEVVLTEYVFTLSPGDMLIAFTDGVSEACVDGDMLGEVGLEALLQKVTADKPSAQEVAQRIQEDVQARMDTAARDDMAVLVTKITGAAPQ